MRTRVIELLAAASLTAVGCDARSTREEVPARVVRQASTKVASMHQARYGHALLTLADGRVLAYGNRSQPLTDAEIYDPSNDTWSPTSTHPQTYYGPLLALAGGLVVAMTPAADGTALVFDASSNAWQSTLGAMSIAHVDHRAVKLLDGRAMIVGGNVWQSGSAVATTLTELFDPTTQTFGRTGDLAQARVLHSVTALDDGRVLVVGGTLTGQFVGLKSVEVWSPTTQAFTTGKPMLGGHASHTSARLPSGRVLVANGFDEGGSGTSSVEAYDPVADAWRALAPTATRRIDAAMIALADGRVLLVGGSDPYQATSATEIYDEAKNAWSAGPTLAEARAAPALARLADGSVLVTGGLAATTLSSAEILSLADLGLDAGVADAGHDAADAADAADSTAPLPDALAPDTAPPVVSGEAAHACKAASDCTSGFCVDGVCCDSKCDAPCHSCALASSPGKCSLEPYGIDLRRECGAGNACTATCDGSGTCVPMRGGEQCAPTTCVDATHAASAAYCASVGAACPTERAATFDCGAYACAPEFGACLTSCIGSDQCAPGYACDLASQHCISAPAPSNDGGCAVRASSTSTGSALGFALGLGAAAAAWRARDRRRRGPPKA